MYGNPTFDCDGARMRAQCRQLATVVAIYGDIDIVNIDRVIAYARRFVLAEKPFVLDLSGVNSFAIQGNSLLYAIDEECSVAGVEWALIASQPVIRVLGELEDAASVPFASSVAEALHHFAEGNLARRRLLPILTKTA